MNAYQKATLLLSLVMVPLLLLFMQGMKYRGTPVAVVVAVSATAALMYALRTRASLRTGKITPDS
jgi:uncharacterized membrane protein YfcA